MSRYPDGTRDTDLGGRDLDESIERDPPPRVRWPADDGEPDWDEERPDPVPEEEPCRVGYDSNNSGGDWWLTDEHWEKLEAAGWVVHWREKRWLGARATAAHRLGLPLDEAMAEFHVVTGLDPSDSGCACCGPPHEFFRADADGRRIYD